MAYMSQQKKAELAPGINGILKEYGVKGTLSVRHNMALVLKITSGPIDFIGNYNTTNQNNIRNQPVTDNYMNVNTHWINEHFSGIAKEFLTKIHDAMNVGNYDNSDIMSDYFEIGWYSDIHIGVYNKPYKLVK